MEASMLQKVKGFKYLYREQFKKFGKLMEKSDKELEMDNNYRHKLWNDCHAPNPGPTRLADLNRFSGPETQDWDSLLDFFFFKNRTGTCGYGPHLITESKSHIHLQSPIYIYKTELLHLQIRARNLL